MGASDSDDRARAVAAFEAAPFDPARWSEGLDLLARIGGGWAGQLCGVSLSSGILFNIITQIPAELNEEWERRHGGTIGQNPRAASLLTSSYSVTSDADYISDSARARSTFYRELFEPADVPHMAVGMLAHRGDTRIFAAVARSRSQGAAESADKARIASLLRHIDAAVTVSLRLDGIAIAATNRSLDSLGMIAVQCDHWGRIVGMTEAAEAMVRRASLLRSDRGRLCAIDRAGNERLQSALRRAVIRPGEWGLPVRSTALALSDLDGRPTRVDVTPLPPCTDNFYSSAACLVIVSSEGQCEPQVAAEILGQVFGLTPTEASIAHLLAQGGTAGQIAEQRHVSVHTVRVQIAAVYQKMGVTKATQLAAVMRRIGL